MAKFPQSKEYKEYKRNLRKFAATINPKPSKRKQNEMRRQYMEARGSN